MACILEYSILANFCLLTVCLSLNKNPKVIPKSSKAEYVRPFCRISWVRPFLVISKHMAKGMNLSHAPHNWHKRQFQKRATNIFISNSCIGACALFPKVPSLKDSVHLDTGGLMGILKTCLVSWGSNLHLEEMGAGRVRSSHLWVLWSLLPIILYHQTQFAISRRGVSAWVASWQPAQECGPSLVKVPTFLLWNFCDEVR